MALLEKQMEELKISDKEEVFVGFEDQVKALKSVLELRMGQRPSELTKHLQINGILIHGE